MCSPVTSLPFNCVLTTIARLAFLLLKLSASSPVNHHPVGSECSPREAFLRLATAYLLPMLDPILSGVKVCRMEFEDIFFGIDFALRLHRSQSQFRKNLRQLPVSGA